MMRSVPPVGTGRSRGARAGLLDWLLAAGRLDGGALHDHAGLLAGRRLARRAPGRDGAALDADRWLLEAVRAHRAQPGVGDELTALLVLVVAVHEGVFLGLPVEALEAVGDVRLALLPEHALHVVGEARGDQAVRHGAAGRVHVALGQAHAALAVHRRQVHLARGRGRQPDVARLPDLRRDDVDVDREQAALLDRVRDGGNHGGPVAPRHADMASFTMSVRFL